MAGGEALVAGCCGGVGKARSHPFLGLLIALVTGPGLACTGVAAALGGVMAGGAWSRWHIGCSVGGAAAADVGGAAAAGGGVATTEVGGATAAGVDVVVVPTWGGVDAVLAANAGGMLAAWRTICCESALVPSCSGVVRGSTGSGVACVTSPTSGSVADLLDGSRP